MDFYSLKKTVKSITLSDIKYGIRQIQNSVMNVTEMEAKVREATNNDPWPSRTGLSREISDATGDSNTLNEIIVMIFRRFIEKEAEQWRQIQKSLDLLDYLIKNGSEKVIDEARARIHFLKMLKQFNYIDIEGKDKGRGIREKSQRIVEVLAPENVAKLRALRKDAKKGNPSSMGSLSSLNFGNRRVYGDGGGYGGESSDYTDHVREEFEEYDEFEHGVTSPSASTSSSVPKKKTLPATRAPVTTKALPKPKVPEVDLFSFDDPDSSAPAIPALNKPATSPANLLVTDDDEDEFDDFQSAPTASSTLAAPLPSFVSPAVSKPPLNGISAPPSSSSFTSSAFSTVASPSPSSASIKPNPPPPTNYKPGQPNYFSPVSASTSSTQSPLSHPHQPPINTPSGGLSLPAASSAFKPTAKSSSGGDAFAGLLGNLNLKNSGKGKGQSMADMAKQSSSPALWKNSSTSSSTASPLSTQQNSASGSQQQGLGNGLDDLLG